MIGGLKKSALTFIFILSATMLHAQHAGPDSATTEVNNKQESSAMLITMKTDFLSLFNSFVEKNEHNFTLSFETGISRFYNIQLNGGYENISCTDYRCSGMQFDIEIRRYLLIDNCACSAIHAGAYFGFGEAITTAQNKYLNYLRKTETSFESGMAGGYEAFINAHWLIDPTVNVGISGTYKQSEREQGTVEGWEDLALMVRMNLNIGYRF